MTGGEEHDREKVLQEKRQKAQEMKMVAPGHGEWKFFSEDNRLYRAEIWYRRRQFNVMDYAGNQDDPQHR